MVKAITQTKKLLQTLPPVQSGSSSSRSPQFDRPADAFALTLKLSGQIVQGVAITVHVWST
jgi:hypothetical protein